MALGSERSIATKYVRPELLRTCPEDAIRLMELCFSNVPDNIEFFVETIELAARNRNWPLVVAIGRHILMSGIQVARVYSLLFDAFWGLERAQEAGAILDD